MRKFKQEEASACIFFFSTFLNYYLFDSFISFLNLRSILENFLVYTISLFPFGFSVIITHCFLCRLLEKIGLLKTTGEEEAEEKEAINHLSYKKKEQALVYMNEKLRALYYKYDILPDNEIYFQDEIKEIEKKYGELFEKWDFECFSNSFIFIDRLLIDRLIKGERVEIGERQDIASAVDGFLLYKDAEEAIQKGIANARKCNRAAQKKMEKDLAGEIGDDAIIGIDNVRALRDALKTHAKGISPDIVYGEGFATFNRIMADVEQNTGIMYRWFRTVREFYSDQMVHMTEGSRRRAMAKRVYGALSEDLLASLNKISPAIFKRYEETIRFTSKFNVIYADLRAKLAAKQQNDLRYLNDDYLDIDDDTRAQLDLDQLHLDKMWDDIDEVWKNNLIDKPGYRI